MPGLHGIGCSAPVKQKLSGGHAWHSPSAASPLTLPKRPAGHESAALLPADRLVRAPVPLARDGHASELAAAGAARLATHGRLGAATMPVRPYRAGSSATHTKETQPITCAPTTEEPSHGRAHALGY